MNKSYPITLLTTRSEDTEFNDAVFAQKMQDVLSDNLKAYDVDATIKDSRMTPFTIMFDVEPAPGVSVKKIKDLRVDLELRLGSPVEVVNSGEQFTIQIALKSILRPIVGLRSILESDEFTDNNYKLPVAVGMDVLGKPFVFDLADAPHMLVAGTTGSGKSTFLNALILSLMYVKTPNEIQFIMVDPKRVELGPYNGIPYLMMPVVTSPKQALFTLNATKGEMDRRYRLFESRKHRDIDAFNDDPSVQEKIPRIIVIVDEYADMIESSHKELEKTVTYLTQKGRAAGIHLILSTQMPSSDIITPIIKANLPCRASFTVVDGRESKTIIDRTGAERLIGNGDMLYSATESSSPVHAQAAYVSCAEVDSVIDYLKEY